jgi:hypothetical protein
MKAILKKVDELKTHTMNRHKFITRRLKIMSIRIKNVFYLLAKVLICLGLYNLFKRTKIVEKNKLWLQYKICKKKQRLKLSKSLKIVQSLWNFLTTRQKKDFW